MGLKEDLLRGIYAYGSFPIPIVDKIFNFRYAHNACSALVLL
jgi:hypothetical protein